MNKPRAYFTVVNDLAIIVNTFYNHKHLVITFASIIKNITYNVPRGISLNIHDIIKIYHDKYILELRPKKDNKVKPKFSIKGFLEKSFFKTKALENKNENIIDVFIEKQKKSMMRRVFNEYDRMFMNDKVKYFEVPNDFFYEIQLLKRAIFIHINNDLMDSFSTDTKNQNQKSRQSRHCETKEKRWRQLQELKKFDENLNADMFLFYRDIIVPYREIARKHQNLYSIDIFDFVETMNDELKINLHSKCKKLFFEFECKMDKGMDDFDKLTDDIFSLISNFNFDVFRRYILKIDKCISYVDKLYKSKAPLITISYSKLINDINLPIISLMQFKSLFQALLQSIFDEKIYDKCSEKFKRFTNQIEKLNTIKKEQENYVILLKLQTAIKNLPNNIISYNKEFVNHIDTANYTFFLLSDILVFTERLIAKTDIQSISKAQFVFLCTSKISEYNIFESNSKFYFINIINKKFVKIDVAKNQISLNFVISFYKLKSIHYGERKDLRVNIKNCYTTLDPNCDYFYSNSNTSTGSIEFSSLQNAEVENKNLACTNSFNIQYQTIFCSNSTLNTNYRIVLINEESYKSNYNKSSTVYLIKNRDGTYQVLYNDIKHKCFSLEDFSENLEAIFSPVLFHQNEEDNSTLRNIVKNKILQESGKLKMIDFSAESSYSSIYNQMIAINYIFSRKKCNDHFLLSENKFYWDIEITDKKKIESIVNYFYKIVLIIFSSDDIEKICKEILYIKSKSYFFKYAINNPFLEIFQFLIKGYSYYKYEPFLSIIENVFADASKDDIIMMTQNYN